MKRGGLFEDIPTWVWAAWVVAGLASMALTGAFIWLILSVAGWLSSH